MSVVGGEAFDVECILNKRPEKELVLATTESSSSVGSEATTKEQTAEAKEPVKKKRGRKPLPPELRAKKFLKTPSKALPRQAKPAIKKPLLPDSFRGITRSSRNLLDVPSGQSSSSSGQGQVDSLAAVARTKVLPRYPQDLQMADRQRRRHSCIDHSEVEGASYDCNTA
ncbi:hypothetical protein COCON_G00027860 [Conger conger]|uniref:Uncharacterized protein n=1 Tax=Conger conger TaxID=82655 RepID=A0A9Q1I6V6_CONCO|nr:hypothetical protein COCON_G00027860 [Conger conger]